MKWVQERDLLIAQTMAFVQSVSGKRPPAEVSPEVKVQIDLSSSESTGKVVQASVSSDFVARAAEPTRDPRIVEIPRLREMMGTDMRQEIRNRVELFRAHQQLFHKARDDHFISTMAQVHASSKNQNRSI